MLGQPVKQNTILQVGLALTVIKLSIVQKSINITTGFLKRRKLFLLSVSIG
jgi:hypothetical protein